MRIGYARVSRSNQDLVFQYEILKKARSEKIFIDKNNSFNQRPQFDLMISELKEGDVIVTYNLVKISKSLTQLLDLINLFIEKDIHLIIIKDNYNTRYNLQRMFLQYFLGLFVEVQQDLLKERTNTSVKYKRNNVQINGRENIQSVKAMEKAFSAWQISQNTDRPVSEIVKLLNISHSTYSRYLKVMEKSKNPEMIKKIELIFSNFTSYT